MNATLPWSRIDTQPDAIADQLNAAVNARYMELPRTFCSLADAGKLVLTADYSGDRPDSRYRTLGLLLVDDRDVPAWKQRLQALRSGRLGRRRISYKNVHHDAVRWASLPHYLATTRDLHGYCVAVAIEKTMPPLVGDVESHTGPLAPLSTWPKPLRRWALDVTVVIATLLASTLRPDTDITFITDDDDLVANAERTQQFLTLLSVVVAQTSSKRFGNLQFRTTGRPSENLFIEDLCALPDLAAGTLMDFLRSQGQAASNHALRVPSETLHQRTQGLMAWMLAADGGLTRLAAIIDSASAPYLAAVRLLRRFD